MTWFNELKEFLAVAMPWMLGGAAVVIINWFKERLTLTGWNALALTAVISAVLAAGSLIVSGQLEPNILKDPTQFSETLLAILLTSQLIYRQLEQEQIKRTARPKLMTAEEWAAEQAKKKHARPQ